MKPTRVAFVVNNLDVGGLEKVVISLLTKLNRAQFDPQLICLNGPGKLFGDAKLASDSTLVLEKRQKSYLGLSLDLSALAAIRRFVSQRSIRLIHTHNAAPLIYGGLASRTLLRRPRIIYSEHNQIYSASNSAKKKFRFYLKLADSVISVSHDLAKSLRDSAGWRGPIEVIHNGIDGHEFAIGRNEKVRAELGVTKDTFLIGAGVVLSRQKGISDLIDAAQRVCSKCSRATFVIAGDGPLRTELETLGRQSGLGSRLRFLGFRNDMPDFIAALDLYVLPSLWEGLPLALCEALAVGKPIVCTNVGGNSEVVIDGENGYVVPVADPVTLSAAILKVSQETGRTEAYRKNNRDRFEQHFSDHAMVTAHEELYNRLLEPTCHRSA
jgi:glycosyltransferase involved in cell wall biosynthesis